MEGFDGMTPEQAAGDQLSFRLYVVRTLTAIQTDVAALKAAEGDKEHRLRELERAIDPDLPCVEHAKKLERMRLDIEKKLSTRMLVVQFFAPLATAVLAWFGRGLVH